AGPSAKPVIAATFGETTKPSPRSIRDSASRRKPPPPPPLLQWTAPQKSAVQPAGTDRDRFSPVPPRRRRARPDPDRVCRGLRSHLREKASLLRLRASRLCALAHDPPESAGSSARPARKNARDSAIAPASGRSAADKPRAPEPFPAAYGRAVHCAGT